MNKELILKGAHLCRQLEEAQAAREDLNRTTEIEVLILNGPTIAKIRTENKTTYFDKHHLNEDAKEVIQQEGIKFISRLKKCLDAEIDKLRQEIEDL